MDAMIPPEYSDNYDYSHYMDYFNDSSVDGHGLCVRTHNKEFASTYLPVFYVVFCIFGFTCNLTLIVIFIKYKILRRTFPLHMVISDVLFSSTLPFWGVYAHSHWIFGIHGCKVVTLIYMISLYSSNFFVACMSLHRCMGQPCSFCNLDNISTSMKKVVICVAVWALAFLASLPNFSFIEVHEFRGEKICTYHLGHSRAWKVVIRFEMIVFGFGIPFLIMLLSLRKLYLVVKTAQPAKRSRMLRRGGALTGMFFLLWFPFSVVNFLQSLQELHIISDCATSLHLDFAIQLTECLAYTHVFLNPLFYGFVNKKVWRHRVIDARGQREYLPGLSESSTVLSSQGTAIELRAVQQIQANESGSPQS